MKDKTLFVTPYHTEWNQKCGVRLTDSAYITMIRNGLASSYGNSIWPMMVVDNEQSNIEISLHSLDAMILPPVENRASWEGIPLPPIETLQGKIDLMKKEAERRKANEED